MLCKKKKLIVRTYVSTHRRPWVQRPDQCLCELAALLGFVVWGPTTIKSSWDVLARPVVFYVGLLTTLLLGRARSPIKKKTNKFFVPTFRCLLNPPGQCIKFGTKRRYFCETLSSVTNAAPGAQHLACENVCCFFSALYDCCPWGAALGMR